MTDGSMTLLGADRDKEDLAWLGLEADTNVFFWVQD